jgi:hypothetical protein
MPLQQSLRSEAFPQESDAVFEHRTGAAVKELDDGGGRVKQQRARSVAKKKTGRRAARSPMRDIRRDYLADDG